MPAAFVLGGLALLARADSKTELQALLGLPLSPGSVALLAQHATDPAVHRRYAEALRDPRPETRAVAARAIHAIGAALRSEVEKAFLEESDPEAAREELRALVLLAPTPETDPKIRAAAARFGGRLDPALLHSIARTRGAGALSFYFDSAESFALGRRDLRQFFAVASLGTPELLERAGARALEKRDARAWAAILSVAEALPVVLPSALLRSALDSPVDEIRGETGWAMARLYAGRKSGADPALLGSLTPRESAGVESEFGIELLARSLGRSRVEQARWIAAVEAEGTPNAFDLLPDGPLFGLLTPAERDAIVRKYRPSPPPAGFSVASDTERPPPELARPPSPGPRSLSGLPPGLVADLLAVSGCRPGGSVVLGAAEVSYGLDGRPRKVALVRLADSKRCQPAAQAMLLLSLASPDQSARPERPELISIALVRDCLSALEEEDVSGTTDRGGFQEPTPYRVGGDVKAPKVVKSVEPEYPASTRSAGREGVVIVEGVIGVEGCVRDLRVLKSAGSELDLESLLATSRWRYEPARLNGRPVPVFLTVRSTFNLHR